MPAGEHWFAQKGMWVVPAEPCMCPSVPVNVPWLAQKVMYTTQLRMHFLQLAKETLRLAAKGICAAADEPCMCSSPLAREFLHLAVKSPCAQWHHDMMTSGQVWHERGVPSIRPCFPPLCFTLSSLLERAISPQTVPLIKFCLDVLVACDPHKLQFLSQLSLGSLSLGIATLRCPEISAESL